MIYNLNLLKQHLSECQEAFKKGETDQNILDFYTELHNKFSNLKKEDWAHLNDVMSKLPENESEIELIINTHLMIEQRIKKFITLRFVNPKPFENANSFNASHYITLGESMCLDNPEPKWLWDQIKLINKIRNQVAHNFDLTKAKKLINQLITNVSKKHNVKQELVNVLCHLIGMLKGLCDLAEEPGFQLHR